MMMMMMMESLFAKYMWIKIENFAVPKSKLFRNLVGETERKRTTHTHMVNMMEETKKNKNDAYFHTK